MLSYSDPNNCNEEDKLSGAVAPSLPVPVTASPSRDGHDPDFNLKTVLTLRHSIENTTALMDDAEKGVVNVLEDLEAILEGLGQINALSYTACLRVRSLYFTGVILQIDALY